MPRFTRVEHIVTAGQGALWIARDNTTGHRTVLKYLSKSGHKATDEIAAQRFEREVRTQSTLIHPNIMPILGHDFSADPPWYAMPLADLTLIERLQTGLPLSVAELSEIMAAVFEAIETAHGQYIVHRDLTPANILRLTDSGDPRWVVADFGLCRDVRAESAIITHTSTAVGSVQYMAPEQFSDAHRVGFTADVYSLGCILYHCLTGTAPGYRELKYDSLPESFRLVVEKATAHSRSERYTGVRGLRVDFESIAKPADPTAIREAADRLHDGLQGRVLSWLEQWATASADVNDLSNDRLNDLVKYLLVQRGYRITEGHGHGQAGVTFVMEDPAHGSVPVKLGRHRFRAPSTDVHQLVAAMLAADSRRGLLITTGTLSREARIAVDRDRRVIVIEGPMLHTLAQKAAAHLERGETA